MAGRLALATILIRELLMMITKKKRPVYKALRDFSVGEYVETPFKDKAEVVSIQKSPKDRVYKIMLSNGNFIKTGEQHYNTVSFRKENGKKVYDTVTTKYIYDNLNKYTFEMPTFETFDDVMSLSLDEVIKMLPNHEYEPADDVDQIRERENGKVYIESIELSEDEEAWCLTLNDPLGLYMVDHGTITHNSTFTQMALLFVAACFALMRDPWKFFSKSKTTVFAITICAVTLTKAKEIYEEPIRQLIESAEFWHFCRSHAEMLKEEEHLRESDNVEYIPWSNGGPQPLDSKVYLPDGSYKLMGDIKVGDKIASPTTKECTVIDIPYENENDICYEIELDDGRTCKCAANHKWRVAWEKNRKGDWIWKVVPIEFIMSHPELEFEIFEGEFTKEIEEKAGFFTLLHKSKIVSIKRIENQCVKCITVSNKDGMYITDNFINTHNSVGILRTGNNLTWKAISDAGALLGVNILMGAMTEITFFLEAGKGWALNINTPILLKDGSTKLLKDLEIGDELAHPDGKENKVLKIPFEDEDDEYKITLDDGREVFANYHHIWKVSFRKDRNGEKIWDLVETGFMLENLDKYSFEIPEVPLKFTTLDLAINSMTN